MLHGALKVVETVKDDLQTGNESFEIAFFDDYKTLCYLCDVEEVFLSHEKASREST